MIVLLTGITGLVGCYAAISLLEAGHRVLALARSRNGLSADRRVRRILEAHPEYGVRYGIGDLHVLEGDILKTHCGIEGQTLETLRGHLDVVVHCAGDVAFTGDAEEASAETNVVGVGSVAGLLQELSCRRLVHVGTAYIESALSGEGFRTRYEQSKYAGEVILREAAARGHMELKVVRPSIVTGDTVYGFTPTYHGIYPFLRYAVEYVDELRHVRPSECLPPDLVPNGRVNLVPADHVAAVIREVVCRPEIEAREFNVTSPVPWRAWDLVRIVSRYIGVMDDVFAQLERSEATLSDSASMAVQMLQDRYAPYFDVDLALDTAATDRLREIAGIPTVENRAEWIFALLKWGSNHEWKGLDQA